jgi:hypothetical protein
MASHSHFKSPNRDIVPKRQGKQHSTQAENHAEPNTPHPHHHIESTAQFNDIPTHPPPNAWADAQPYSPLSPSLPYNAILTSSHILNHNSTIPITSMCKTAPDTSSTWRPTTPGLPMAQPHPVFEREEWDIEEGLRYGLLACLRYVVKDRWLGWCRMWSKQR